MRIEDQVCTRQQGERLAELGIKGKGIFCYCYVNPGGHNHEDSYETILPTGFNLTIPDLATTFIADAWTAAELGDILTAYSEIGHSFRLIGSKDWYHSWSSRGKLQPILGPCSSEALARAEMLIYLIEHNLLTPSDVNARMEQNDKE